MTTILKEMRIVQLCSYNLRTIVRYCIFYKTNIIDANFYRLSMNIFFSEICTYISKYLHTVFPHIVSPDGNYSFLDLEIQSSQYINVRELHEHSVPVGHK